MIFSVVIRGTYACLIFEKAGLSLQWQPQSSVEGGVRTCWSDGRDRTGETTAAVSRSRLVNCIFGRLMLKLNEMTFEMGVKPN